MQWPERIVDGPNVTLIPDQIEYWSRIGKLAEENPDLPSEFIKGTLLGLQEIKDGDVREDKNRMAVFTSSELLCEQLKRLGIDNFITSYILQKSAVNSSVPFTLVPVEFHRRRAVAEISQDGRGLAQARGQPEPARQGGTACRETAAQGIRSHDPTSG